MMLIPQKIYVAWPNKDIVNNSSVIIKNGLTNLIKLNPHWEVTIFDDQEVDQYLKDNIDTTDYNLIKDQHIIAKIDVWRLVKLYNEGGIYIDLDRYCNVHLDDVIESTAKCVLPTCLDLDFSHDIMITAANNPIHLTAYILNMQRRKEGHTSIYLLGPQTYMHAITLNLCEEMIDPNPGIDRFNEIRSKIYETSFIQTYRESPPLDTFVYKHSGDQTLEDWEQNKRKLYASENLRHWTNEW